MNNDVVNALQKKNYWTVVHSKLYIKALILLSTLDAFQCLYNFLRFPLFSVILHPFHFFDTSFKIEPIESEPLSEWEGGFLGINVLNLEWDYDWQGSLFYSSRKWCICTTIIYGDNATPKAVKYKSNSHTHVIFMQYSSELQTRNTEISGETFCFALSCFLPFRLTTL